MDHKFAITNIGYQISTINSYGLIHSSNRLSVFKYMPKESMINNIIEIDILARLRHPNLCYTTDIISHINYDISGLLTILPISTFTVFSICEREEYTFNGRLRHFFQLLNAIKFLHDNNTTHNNIKLENMVITGEMKSINNSDILVVGLDDCMHKGNIHSDYEKLGIVLIQLMTGGQHNKKWKFVPENQINNIVVLLNIIMTTSNINTIIKHSLFGGEKLIDGYMTNIPDIPDTINPNAREIMKYISIIHKESFPDCKVEVLFLAYDIAYRSGNVLGDNIALIAGTCSWIAYRLVENQNITADSWIKAINKSFAISILIETMIIAEKAIISELSGCLYRSYIYAHAIDIGQLTKVYAQIILDPSVYYIIDYKKWYSQNPPTNTAPKELITVKQFFQ